MMISAKKGDRLTLRILKVEHPSCIWACGTPESKKAESQTEYRQLQREIAQYFNDFETQKIPLNNPVHHQVGIARRSRDRSWHRVRVEDGGGHSQLLTCFLLDEGVVEAFSPEWLFDAPPPFLRLPYQAQHYRLAGVKPLTYQTSDDLSVSRRPSRTWNPCATKFVNRHLRGQPNPVAEVVHVQRSGVLHIRLNVPPDGECLNDLLVKEEYGYSTQQFDNSGSSADEMSSNAGDKPPPLEEFIDPSIIQMSDIIVQKEPPTHQQTTPRSTGRGLLSLGQLNLASPVRPGGVQDVGASSSPAWGPGRGGRGSGRGLLGLLSGSSTSEKIPGRGSLKTSSPAAPPLTRPLMAPESGISTGCGRGLNTGSLAGITPLAKAQLGVKVQGHGNAQEETTTSQGTVSRGRGQMSLLAALGRVQTSEAQLPDSSSMGHNNRVVETSPVTHHGQGDIEKIPPPLSLSKATDPVYMDMPELIGGAAMDMPKLNGSDAIDMPNRGNGDALYMPKPRGSDAVDIPEITSDVIPPPHAYPKKSPTQDEPSKASRAEDKPQTVVSEKKINRSPPISKPVERTKPRTLVTPMASITGRPTEAIPIPKLPDVTVSGKLASRIPGTGGRQESGSRLQSRLPKFAQKNTEKPKEVTFRDREEVLGPRPVSDYSDQERLPTKSILKMSGSDSEPQASQSTMVKKTNSQHSRSVSNKSDQERLPTKSILKMSGSDSEPQPTQSTMVKKTNSQHSRLVSNHSDQERQQTKSILKMSGSDSEPQPSRLTMVKETNSRDSSPEREEVDVPITGHRKNLDQLMCHDGADSDSEAFTFYTATEAPTSDTLGVLLDGEVLPQFVQNTKLLFDSTINQVIDRLDIMPTNIQSYCWPALLRMRNLVGVASAYRPAPSAGGSTFRQGGTTIAYLIPLVAQLLQKSVYEGVPQGVGPLALVVCSSWRRVHTVYTQTQAVLGGNISLRVVELYGGGSEQSQEVRLINGCDLLLATPQCLLRMIERNIVELKRLCHLVFDDGDKLIKYHSDQVEELLGRYEDCLEAFTERSAPTQVVLMAKHWTPGIASFMEQHMPEPTIVIASTAEGAIYCQVQKIVHVVQADQRLSKLSHLLECSNLKKTIIFTKCPMTAVAVHEALTRYSVYALLCHEDLPPTAQDMVRREWDGPYSSGSPPVLVLTDTMLGERWHHDAEMVIHYDPPLRKELFGPRLWCMYSNFRRPLQNSETPKEATSILLVTEEWQDYIHLVIKDLRHSGLPVPEALTALGQGVSSEKEKEKYTELCRAFKAYGKCGMEQVCRARHSIQRHLDTPGQHSLHQKLPTSGNIKVYVTGAEDASRLWVRLLEHTGGGQVTDLRTPFTELSFSLPMHYFVESNRIPCTYPAVGDLYVIKDIQHTYNRVQVQKIKHKYNTMIIERVQVRKVDIGEVLWVDPSDLLVLHESFLKYPFQAVEVFVCGVRPTDDDVDWTNYASDHVYDAVYGQQLDGRIVLALGNTLWLDPLVKREFLKSIGTVTHSVVVHRTLLHNDYAVPNPEHMRLLYAACANNVDLPDVLCLESVPHMAYDQHGLPSTLRMAVLPESGVELPPVEVTAVLHPGLFYARLSNNLKKLEEVHEEIKDHVKVTRPNPDTIGLLQPGSLILATFPHDKDEEGRVWYRGKIQAVTEDGEFDVLYLDTGESEYVAPDQARPMPTMFTHWPFQAIECRLAHIKPTKGEDWDEETGELLWQLVSYSQGGSKPLLAEVVSTEKAANVGLVKYAVRLFDTSAEFDIDVAQELVTQGAACVTEGLVKGEMPPVDETVKAPYAKLPALCTDLVTTTDPEQQVMILDQIQKIVRTSTSDVEGMCKCRAVGALCQALGYLSNMDIVELLCKCLLLLTKINTTVFDAILQDDGVTTLCRMLSRSNVTGHKVVTCTIAELVLQHRLREEFVNRGALRLLSPLLENMETEDSETIRQALVALRELTAALTERHRSVVLRSGCVAAICHQLEHSTDHTNLVNGLQALRSLLLNVRIQEESRRWAGPVLCSHLRTSYDQPDLISHVVLAVAALARGSCINKESLLAYDIVDALAKTSEDAVLTTEARSECRDLHNSLSSLRRTEEYGEIPQHSSPDRPERGSGQEERRPELEVPNNVPLPADILHTVERTAHPQIDWFQDRRNLVLLVQVKNVHDNLMADISEQLVRFSTVVERVQWFFELPLFELIDPNRCDTQVRPGEVRIGLRKVTKGNWPRVTKGKGKLPYLCPDFSRYIEESDSDSEDDNANDREKESPLEIIERCKPRPQGLPAPTTEYVRNVIPDHVMPYDPTDDPDYRPPSTEDSDVDERLRMDEQDEDLKGHFFNL